MPTKRHATLLLKTIGLIYDAALASEGWSTIGSHIARTVDASSAALLLNHRSAGQEWLSWTQNFTDEALRSYREHYHKLDVWADRAGRIEKSRVFTNEELMADNDFVRTEFYRDWSRKVVGFRVVGTIMDVDTEATCVLGAHRPEDSYAFANHDRGALEILLPHLRRALLVHRRLMNAQLEHQSALDALERVALATLVVGRSGEILYANRHGESLLRAGNGLQSSGNRLHATDAASSNQLACLVRNACDRTSASSAGALKVDRIDRLPLTILVVPVNPSNERFALSFPAALVLVRDPEQVTATADVMRELFGFTAMEARLAESLSRGRSLEDFARGNGISINTARTHLRGLLLKTDTKRQAELVSFLLRSVAFLEPV